MPAICTAVPAPSGMMAPSPNCFSIWASVFFKSGLLSNTDSGSLDFLPALFALAVSLGMRLFDFVAVTMGKSFSLEEHVRRRHAAQGRLKVRATALVNAC